MKNCIGDRRSAPRLALLPPHSAPPAALALAPHRRTAGFTAMELLTIMVIISIISALLVPNLMKGRNHAIDSSAKEFVRQCVTAVELARDATTNALPSLAAGCDDDDAAPDGLGSAALARPSSVTSSSLIFGSDTFAVNVTASNGNEFTFDGKTVTAGTTASMP